MRNSGKCKSDTLEKKSRFGEWLCRCAYECLEYVQKTHKLILKGWPDVGTHIRGICTFLSRKFSFFGRFRGHIRYALGHNAKTLCFEWSEVIFASLFFKPSDAKTRKMAQWSQSISWRYQFGIFCQMDAQPVIDCVSSENLMVSPAVHEIWFSFIFMPGKIFSGREIFSTKTLGCMGFF